MGVEQVFEAKLQLIEARFKVGTFLLKLAHLQGCLLAIALIYLQLLLYHLVQLLSHRARTPPSVLLLLFGLDSRCPAERGGEGVSAIII